MSTILYVWGQMFSHAIFRPGANVRRGLMFYSPKLLGFAELFFVFHLCHTSTCTSVIEYCKTQMRIFPSLIM